MGRTERMTGRAAKHDPASALTPTPRSIEMRPCLAQYTSLQVQQQRELVDDERQARAVAERHRRVPAVPVLPADRDGATPVSIPIPHR